MSDTQWTFLTNHGHVLICVARDPDQRVRDIANRVGITERAVQRILSELVDAGYVDVTKEGRRNRYTVRRDLELRHPIEAGVTVGEVIGLVERAGCGARRERAG